MVVYGQRCVCVCVYAEKGFAGVLLGRCGKGHGCVCWKMTWMDRIFIILSVYILMHHYANTMGESLAMELGNIFDVACACA